MLFSRSSVIPALRENVFRWHSRPGALERLMPPWEQTQVVKGPSSLQEGVQVETKFKLGPTWIKWNAQHETYIDGREFSDSQTQGPFRSFFHRHIFEDHPDGCLLSDRIEFEMPLGPVGRALAASYTYDKLDRLFFYRHAVVRNDLSILKKYSLKPMRILISGASGMIGSNLKAFLSAAGHDVHGLTRSETNASEKMIHWNPLESIEDPSIFENFEVIIHLAGENIAGGRWNEEFKKRLIESRTKSTQHLSEALLKCKTKPRVLVCASAIGYYGEHGDEALSEEASSGDGFLAELCREWESSTDSLKNSGIRIIHLRSGMVISPQGGALKKMLLPFKFGLGAILGNGKQFWSWISLDDFIYALYHCLATEAVSGAVNMVSPEALTNRQFSKVLASSLHRPLAPPVPKTALKLVQGEMADQLLLASTKAIPKKLLDTGFQFVFPELRETLEHSLGITS